MSCYMAKRAKKTPRVVGLMSGTSAEGRLRAAIVMHVCGVHLLEALDILKDNNELLRPAIAEFTERV